MHECRDLSVLYIKIPWHYHLILSLYHGTATVLYKGRQISCSWKQTKQYTAPCKKFRACFTIFPRLPHSSFKVMAPFVPPSDVMQSSWHAWLLHLYSALSSWTLELLQSYCWPLCGFSHKSGRFDSLYFLITQYAVSTGISKHYKIVFSFPNSCICFTLFLTCLEHTSVFVLERDFISSQQLCINCGVLYEHVGVFYDSQVEGQK